MKTLIARLPQSKILVHPAMLNNIGKSEGEVESLNMKK
jgi:hypothetical protein